MTNFNELFGGNTIAPAQLSYIKYTTAVNLVLQWDANAASGANVTAQKIDVFAQNAGLSVQLPPANQVSQGRDILFRNVGGNTFSVIDANGNTLGTVASGQAWYYYLLDNTTAPGSWAVLQFGAGTSTANAGSLAGAGLSAIVTQLNQNLLITALTSNYSPSPADRATVLLETGGVTVFTPASPATLGNGWFVYVINQGTGTLTWSPAVGLIDNAATKVINPTESVVIFTDGTNFWSLGYGRAIVSTVTGANIPLTNAPATVSLSASQIAAQVQDYTGVLANNVTIFMGTGVGYWFVRNATSGAFSLTFAVNGGDAGVTVAQGSFSILRSNGSNVIVAFSGAVGTVTSVATTSDLTGGPIVTTGTLGLSTTGVTASTYGAGLNFPTFSVDNKGRILSAGTIALANTAGVAKSAAVGLADASLMLQLDANGLVPSINGGLQTGDLALSLALSKPGFVFASGQSIGSAASAATQRNNADTLNLYTLLWNNCSNTVCPVSGGRGGSAAADFAANKTLGVPDMRGTVPAGLDVMNASANAGRLTAAFGSTPMGAAGYNNATNATTTAVGFVSTGSNNINFGSPSWTQTGGIISTASGTAVTPGAGQFPQINDQVTVTGVIGAVNGTFGITVSGGGTFASAAFVIAQSTMVMNAFIKL